MAETPRCPDCGSPLAGEDWSEALCSHCLLQLALQESSGAGAEADTPVPVERGSQDLAASTGYRVVADAFPGWAEVPTW